VGASFETLAPQGDGMGLGQFFRASPFSTGTDGFFTAILGRAHVESENPRTS
jgi:hypothetical protein